MASILPYNFLEDTDSYKVPMEDLYPDDTEVIFSYLESRGGRYPSTIFAGPQGYVKQLIANPVTHDQIEEHIDFCGDHFGSRDVFNPEPWRAVVNEYGGHLPVRISAVKEGTLVPYRNALATVYNLDKRLKGLTTHIETGLLRDTWYQSTVATRIFYMKRTIKTKFEKTSDEPVAAMTFALLDFASRGVSSYETSEKGGLGFLFSWVGSDNIPSVRYANKIYNEKMAAYSVIATEHSIQCSYGEDSELDSFRQIIRKAAARGVKIVSVVSDTWNIFRACRFWVQLIPLLKELELTLVIRPDSGNPAEVLPQIFEILKDGFGFTINSKGYMILNGVKVLWGDGINENSCGPMYDIIISLGFAADNLMLGSGGGLMQVDIDRDTNKWAFKAAAIRRAGVWQGIAKNPITDPGKVSKAGAIQLQWDEQDGFHTNCTGLKQFDQRTFDEYNRTSILEPIYDTGALLRDQNLADIRALVNSQL